jgi:hypothetical protein
VGSNPATPTIFLAIGNCKIVQRHALAAIFVCAPGGSLEERLP